MDLNAVTSNRDVYFEIRPGCGDGGCHTPGYMYYSADGSSWTLFWSRPDLAGWTTYSDTVFIAAPFRYIRANTNGCSVDWSYFSVGGVPPSVTAIQPAEGTEGDGEVDMSVQGFDFQDGASFALVNVSLGTLACIPSTLIFHSETELSGKIDLTVAKPGLYDVVVTNPDGGTDTLYNGFRVLPVPVVLVHGWMSDYSNWNKLSSNLTSNGFEVWNFDYKEFNNADPRTIAPMLDAFIDAKKVAYRRDLYPTGYNGKVDIVCHSMGALVSRLYMEWLDNGAHRNDVRQWIGIAPAHRGSALADYTSDNPFVAAVGYLYGGAALFQLQTNSASVQALGRLSSTTKYRVIAGWNPNHSANFGGGLLSATLAKRTTGSGPLYYWTHSGDMIVATAQSRHPDMEFDAFPIGGILGSSSAKEFDHVDICGSPKVINAVIGYLRDITAKSSNKVPDEDVIPHDYTLSQKTVSGYFGRDDTLKRIIIAFIHNNVPFLRQAVIQSEENSTNSALIALLEWDDGDINMTLTSPSGIEYTPDSLPDDIWYSKNGRSLNYIVTAPENGNWTAKLVPVDYPGHDIAYNLTYYVRELNTSSSYPTQPPANVTGPTTITDPGTYYLTQDILDSDADPSCINIASSDVVFDGMGHTIDGTNRAGTFGINAAWNIVNITIRNVTVADWGTINAGGSGINFAGVHGGLIERTTGRNNGHSGIMLYETENVAIRDNALDGSGTGIAAHTNSHDNLISGNSIQNSEWGGVELYEGVYDNTVTANNLVNAQLVLSNQSHDNVLHRNTVTNTRPWTSTSRSPIDVFNGAMGNLIYDNILNATYQPTLNSGSGSNTWSVTPRNGTNILGGSMIGGNVWLGQDRAGFSETHPDGNSDGFCDESFDLGGGNIDLYPLSNSKPAVSPLPGSMEAPTDINGDGKYDDVNGNGRKDFADVVLYFNQMSWISGHEPVAAFDYNGNGRVDFADVVWLFNHL